MIIGRRGKPRTRCVFTYCSLPPHYHLDMVLETAVSIQEKNSYFAFCWHLLFTQCHTPQQITSQHLSPSSCISCCTAYLPLRLWRTNADFAHQYPCTHRTVSVTLENSTLSVPALLELDHGSGGRHQLSVPYNGRCSP